MSYCRYCRENPDDVWNVPYHDTQYGFPIEDDDQLFERLVLEINQAGLSWLTILKKAEGFRRALVPTSMCRSQAGRVSVRTSAPSSASLSRRSIASSPT